ncbi:MAG TPA: alkaline phosphatase D family protein [Schlesneria sp.]
MFELSRISDAVRYEGGISRRLFLAYSAALASLPQLAERAQAAEKNVTFSSDPFASGIASGDPDSTSVVLWTRLIQDPFDAYGGMSTEPIPVQWEVAHDEQFSRIAASGVATATPQLGHSVHAVAQGLEPDRWYFYRFRAGDAQSPVGRCRTLPHADSLPEKLRFASTSCQHFEQGLYTAYEQMQKDDLDLVFHLGDYIYEGPGRDNLVRKHFGKEIVSLGDYRIRFAQYRTDPLLRQMHAACPWFVTWDDHEFDNNYAGEISEQLNEDPVAFLQRRANSYQAYYENMPLRPRSLPKGPDMRLYRKGSFGRLAEFLILDTRQYRTDQPNNDKRSPINDAALNPQATLLGRTQRQWLQSSLLTSQAAWNVLAQQVMMGMVGVGREGDTPLYSMDQWPGYSHERIQLANFLAERRIPNPVVLTGDIHSNWANELRVDDRNPETPLVATEFVATSLSSGGNGRARPDYVDLLQATHPFVKLHNNERGYIRCTVTPQSWTSDYVAVEDVLAPGGNIVTRASFVVEAGRPQLNKA